MSDSYRKDFSDKAAETVKPNSQKSTFEQGKEFVTDKADQAAGKVQPNSEKGVFQGATDSAHEGKNDATGKSVSETAGEYVDAAKSRLNDAAEYVSKSIHGGEEK
ncbi:LANO_0B02608g1_1 [Lachancea nothofagi CBS 11611]|uniref:LANO_0B02608g1_1 n=1 Tax=Lachancea nothofagi CBS 11611 TaxID=1266666 RepID=A0A1G4IWF4_9SACH|nr:LANO_0B02608g1_1 [Lachancea nothofagi CBS 11611]